MEIIIIIVAKVMIDVMMVIIGMPIMVIFVIIVFLGDNQGEDGIPVLHNVTSYQNHYDYLNKVKVKFISNDQQSGKQNQPVNKLSS